MKIENTTIIHPKAKVADSVEVGHYTIIDEDVVIGEGVRIGHHCYLTGNTTIGKNCKIFSNSIIGEMPQDLKFKDEKTFLKIGDNNIIREFVTIHLGTEEGGKTTVIGNNNLIMAYSHIAHDCKIGDNVIIANAAMFAGHVHIEDNATIGGMVAIHQFVRVGRYAIIGGNSRVMQDIPPFSLAAGQPADVVGLNSIGLRRANVSPEIRNTLKKAIKILFKSGLSTNHAIEEIEKNLPRLDEIIYLVNFVKTSERGVAR
ncbi:MAG: acyl-ACP--UDP-N-acetylglucosamine O-acyltransferase [Candidatus Omnitrophica bacterium]|nr:acyl-ACP--UDP-N-acetylglucosamine O-acyltransferase [Candidatus Omnitrophota bacterium]